MSCLACAAGYPRECLQDPHCSKVKIDLETVEIKRGGPRKEDELVTDPKSTGRKRAAVLLPLKDEHGNPYDCAWTGLKFAGGGEYPIIGCLGNPATNRHHGPDKDTLNNDEVGRNLHRICTYCHNRWHGKNDNGYEAYVSLVGGLAFIQAHDQESKASPAEVFGAATRPELEAYHQRGKVIFQ